MGFFSSIFKSKGGSSSSSAPPTPKFQPIPDQFETYEEVEEALRAAGLESSNLVIGIDYTKSNTWTGRRTFNGCCLHDLSTSEQNPYQQVIDMLGHTLAPFDDDNLIPVYGFGDVNTGDRACFNLNPSGEPCEGFEAVLDLYNQQTPSINLSGPTNFAPVINQTIDIVKQERGYHILVLIADGQVNAEKETVEAIVRASHYPMSIIMIGVGDGPWAMMEDFDDGLPKRKFDNFQFVPFHSTMQKYGKNKAAFALEALMEVPDQYRAIQKLQLLEALRSRMGG